MMTELNRFCFNCTNAACPPGFVSIDGHSDSCYKAVRAKFTWSDAVDACKSLHRYAHLVAIDNDEEQEALRNWLQNLGGDFS